MNWQHRSGMGSTPRNNDHTRWEPQESGKALTVGLVMLAGILGAVGLLLGNIR